MLIIDVNAAILCSLFRRRCLAYFIMYAAPVQNEETILSRENAMQSCKLVFVSKTD